MPGMTQIQGDSMGILAASNNIASAIQSDLSAMQDDLNKCAQSGDVAAANDYVVRTGDLMEILDSQKDLPAGQGWMDPSTATNMYNSVKNTIDEFTSWMPADIAKEMQDWTSNPTKSDPGGKTGQQHIQNVQTQETQSTNSVSAQSQTVQAQLQFASNTYNQYLNTDKDMLQSNQQFVATEVQNQKPQ